ncbi:tRNA (adenosine(37)-N6)-threonylcarbamoyltransferase complex ATPase subunit type 1 TsaE [Oceaniglobus indicus]|uniref:tRNA (adenosine(37)-N6)-threonylcarbamoyltransferase complex ATPase subunit type 1 TsaE n=1 Tax=Oceaniglobus indicus TaxID=2047749 RepID=UPI000C19A1EB|nr:tRNA (adenosine(37)-N6)-threonylcarbamoyltransferase complex ATPase subunit type 1 TsaE [Oceaniglobus indicus]
MTVYPIARIDTLDPQQTADLAVVLARHLRAGDTLLLDGPIGAGKTHFARALIRAAQGPDGDKDIPSPTFTLVQTYQTPTCDIWHADLYRLTDVQEVMELGLDDAFESAICLIEWPDRLGDLAPAAALRLTLTVQGDTARQIVIEGAADWSARLASVLPRPKIS